MRPATERDAQDAFHCADGENGDHADSTGEDSIVTSSVEGIKRFQCESRPATSGWSSIAVSGMHVASVT